MKTGVGNSEHPSSCQDDPCPPRFFLSKKIQNRRMTKPVILIPLKSLTFQVKTNLCINIFNIITIFFFLCPPRLYCRSVRWAGPLICVQRSGQSGQLSPAPALAPAPSVRAEGGGRPDRSSEGGGLWQTPGTEQRSEGTRGWEHGTSLPSHSGSDCWEDWTLARLHWHTGHTPPTITRAPHTGAGVAGAHYESLGVSRSRRIVLGCCHKWWRWYYVKQICSATTTNSYPVNPF